VTVIVKRRQRVCGPRGWVPKASVVGAETVVVVEGDMSAYSATGGAERRGLNAPPTGIVERGTYARVAQEPGMESRHPVARWNDTVRATEPVECREVGARSRSCDAGELAPGDPAEQRSAPRNSSAGGRR
jgi:hypothetical protein